MKLYEFRVVAFFPVNLRRGRKLKRVTDERQLLLRRLKSGSKWRADERATVTSDPESECAL
jgi:hypothetical protein